MKKNGRRMIIGLLVLGLITFLSFPAASAEQTTITGTVNDYYQIETDDGTVYDVVENENGDAVAEQVGMVVRVTGTVEEEEDQKSINITSYTIMGEPNTDDEEED